MSAGAEPVATPVDAVPTTLDAVLAEAPGRLARWMDSQALSSGPVEVSPIGGGTQNLLLRVRRGADRYVLRRCALLADDREGTAMRRESQILAALGATPVPHPRLVAFCGDTAVLGASFLLMEDVDGFCPRAGFPDRWAPAAVHRTGLALVNTLIELSRVDPCAAGWPGVRSGGWLERQVDRWRGQLDGYRGIDDYGGDRLPGVAEVGQWLDGHRPAAGREGVVHGDYHLANVIVRHGWPSVAAILDWELASIGDPLLDLGHLLVTWPKGGLGPPELAALPLPGPDELIEHYRAGTGRSRADIHWFTVLAGYRLAIILEGTHARARAGRAPAAVGQRLHTLAEVLVGNARTAIADHG